MERGQLSLDLVLAIIGFLVFLQFIQTFSESVERAGVEHAIQSQVRELASNVGQGITSMQTLYPAHLNATNNSLNGYDYAYSLPLIRTPKTQGKGLNCTIQFTEIPGDSNYVTVTVSKDELEKAGIQVNADVTHATRYAPPSFLLLPSLAHCGETLAFEKKAFG
ncbi:MAG: hypothetical protein HY393_04105 [Candidatus Diapherotrites archaeon]|nr:hypothetical protein [Candidatus Diapherotrites archaeon]